ncbi:MAG: transposase [bacterium]
MEALPKLEPGKLYHIFNRGNNRENIFKEKRNYEYFLRLYKQHICPVADTYAYCLLPNHFHVAVRIKESKEIPEGLRQSPQLVSHHFSNMFNAYAKAINKAFGRSGALFKHRFRRNEIDSLESLVRVICYIHTNPVHHRLTDEYSSYPYSSFQGIVYDLGTPGLLTSCLHFFDGVEKFKYTHEEYFKQRITDNEDLEFLPS